MSVDDVIGDVIDLCEQLGVADNTYFLYRCASPRYSAACLFLVLVMSAPILTSVCSYHVVPITGFSSESSISPWINATSTIGTRAVVQGLPRQKDFHNCGAYAPSLNPYPYPYPSVRMAPTHAALPSSPALAPSLPSPHPRVLRPLHAEVH